MRRLIIFATVALLSFSPLAIRSVSAQEDDAWQGVTVEDGVSRGAQESNEPFGLLDAFIGDPEETQVAATPSAGMTSPPSMADRLDEVYPVVFRNPSDVDLAHIPEVQGAEFMVVIVKTGEFAVDVKGPGSFLVDPVVDPEFESSADADKIPILLAKITKTESGSEVRYEETDQFVRDENGEICTSLCTVLPGVAIQLTVGDRIIAPAGAICIWCLLHPGGETSDPQGTLYVFPLLDAGEDFSWSLYAAGSASGAENATPEAHGYAVPEQLMIGAAPWAFFNPSSSCKG